MASSLLIKSQGLLNEHQSVCPNYRSVPRRDCVLCNGLLKLCSDILAIEPMEPLIINCPGKWTESGLCGICGDPMCQACKRMHAQRLCLSCLRLKECAMPIDPALRKAGPHAQ